MLMAADSVQGTILQTVPLPVFVARYDGELVFMNDIMLRISGRPRTLFGLGIFHNPAEYRGFIQSFKHGGTTRRLALPAGRFKTGDNPLLLYASRIEWEGSAALCGIIHRTGGTNTLSSEGDEQLDTERVLDRLGTLVMRIDKFGRTLYANAPLLLELRTDREGKPPQLADIDVQTDAEALAEHLRRASTQGMADYETLIQRSDGTVLPVAITIRALRRTGKEDELLATITDLTAQRYAEHERRMTEMEADRLKTRLDRSSALIKRRSTLRRESPIVSRSQAYVPVLKQIRQVAPTDSTVLITGETGTGKELIARAIHANSGRADRPLVILNCGALPADLIESELFGYRKGAFTGAETKQLGRFELADEGTLFLDEIGEMPMQLQTRLLRVLQDGAFTPLGAREPTQTDVRVIAASNRDLRRRVSEGQFRADLYFRLNVFPIHSPPLRDRPEDIVPLVDHFLKKYGPADGQPPLIHPDDMERLKNHRFDGNVRELENIIQRALIVSDGDRLRIPQDIGVSEETNSTDNAAAPTTEILSFEEAQRRHIERVLSLTGGKVSGPGGAAELLDLNPQTLFSKMRRLKIKKR